jgi:hypothetical protein
MQCFYFQSFSACSPNIGGCYVAYCNEPLQHEIMAGVKAWFWLALEIVCQVMLAGEHSIKCRLNRSGIVRRPDIDHILRGARARAAKWPRACHAPSDEFVLKLLPLER